MNLYLLSQCSIPSTYVPIVGASCSGAVTSAFGRLWFSLYQNPQTIRLLCMYTRPTRQGVHWPPLGEYWPKIDWHKVSGGHGNPRIPIVEYRFGLTGYVSPWSW
ncbi:hypothetical protein K504DRAFT_249467 [Pleomassaria siparia CBS 279.74]|uniref:Uncharacterized protein n=1 Tax=Pleomassaria siparia CBS 279.74 TaxID=1314801 RepID=A0A6G1KC10_9PLEO|nr:hypothetical protein K504DRAFT_249467 [Pleomassaria siparia CBS 279.74]